MIQGKVTAIGKSAIGEEPLLLLFDDSVKATEKLKDYVIIQEIISGEPTFDLKEGSKISFDEQEYEVTYVGAIANRNLTDINHVSLIFTDVPAEDAILNGVYLTPHVLPKITENTIISYQN